MLSGCGRCNCHVILFVILELGDAVSVVCVCHASNVTIQLRDVLEAADLFCSRSVLVCL